MEINLVVKNVVPVVIRPIEEEDDAPFHMVKELQSTKKIAHR